MQIQIAPNKRRSQVDRFQLTPVQLSLLGTVVFNLAIVLSGASVRAAEPTVMEAEASTPPTAATVGVPVANLEPPVPAPSTTVAEVPLAQRPIPDQAPSLESALPAPALNPLAEVSPPPQEISKQASDLLGSSVPQQPGQETLAQTETPAPADSATDVKPVNNPLIPPPGWRFDFEPYLFLPLSVEGDIFFGRGRPSRFPNLPGGGILQLDPLFNLGVNASLSDIRGGLTSLFGFSGRLQAWNGNVGVVADGLYINSGFEASSDGGTFTLRDRFNIPLPGFRIDTRNTLSSFSLGASYRLGTVPIRTITDPSNPRNYYPAISMEVLAGFRYLSIFQDVDFERGPRFEFSGSEVNPMLGGTIKLLVSDRFDLFFRADTSNLGGGRLKQYYNLLAGVDWKFSGSFALSLAYRLNQVEYVTSGRFGGENGFNLRSQGVQLGLSWRF